MQGSLREFGESLERWQCSNGGNAWAVTIRVTASSMFPDNVATFINGTGLTGHCKNDTTEIKANHLIDRLLVLSNVVEKCHWK